LTSTIAPPMIHAIANHFRYRRSTSPPSNQS
jgi:hypothetical protein